ncbi:hypothetical protein QWJ34_06930 [Saccharibacillus sp. CPCC 101409]|nr:hypothetical protein [Saccharibacillus sp. CPCC 101409]MDO3409492.1 hypothetical protein [Saccharibacillus sp. CPCC 101409]
MKAASLIAPMFKALLRSKKVTDAPLGNHTVTAAKEIPKPDRDFMAPL